MARRISRSSGSSNRSYRSTSSSSSRSSSSRSGSTSKPASTSKSGSSSKSTSSSKSVSSSKGTSSSKSKVSSTPKSNQSKNMSKGTNNVVAKKTENVKSKQVRKPDVDKYVKSDSTVQTGSSKTENKAVNTQPTNRVYDRVTIGDRVTKTVSDKTTVNTESTNTVSDKTIVNTKPANSVYDRATIRAKQATDVLNKVIVDSKKNYNNSLLKNGSYVQTGRKIIQTGKGGYAYAPVVNNKTASAQPNQHYNLKSRNLNKDRFVQKNRAVTKLENKPKHYKNYDIKYKKGKNANVNFKDSDKKLKGSNNPKNADKKVLYDKEFREKCDPKAIIEKAFRTLIDKNYQNYLKSGKASEIDKTIDQILRGDYTENATIAGTVGQILTGIAGIDLPADIRDLTHGVTHWENKPQHVGKVGLTALGLLPMVGVVKYVDEVPGLAKSGGKLVKKGLESLSGLKLNKKAPKLATEIGEIAAKNADELIKGTVKNTDELIKDIIKNADELKNAAKKSIKNTKKGNKIQDSAKDIEKVADKVKDIVNDTGKVKNTGKAADNAKDITEGKIKDTKKVSEGGKLSEDLSNTKKTGKASKRQLHPEWYDSNGNYTGGRSKEELEALAKDPSHYKATRDIDINKGIHEREVGLALEEQGLLKGPITRDLSGKAEFIDANGQKWDVKSFNSNYPPSKGGYTLNDSMKKINKSLAENENVILDTTYLKKEHEEELIGELKNKHLMDKIIIYID